MSAAADYTGLITSEHTDKPNFIAVIVALVQGFSDQVNGALAVPPDFDVDAAVGVQLDAVGLWANITRVITVVPSAAFPAAAPYQVVLDDTTFRRLIKARILANRWDGTPQQVQQLLAVFYGPSGITAAVVDNQDMSINLLMAGGTPTDAEAAVLSQMILPVRPSGVQIKSSYINPTGPLFGLDVENSLISGPDVGGFGGAF